MTQTENTGPTGSKSGKLSDEEVDRIVEMAWEDRTPFDAILMQFGVNESEVIELFRENTTRQPLLSNNKISKRK